MSLPDSRDLTLAQGVPFPSATGNSLQDLAVDLNAFTRKGSFFLRDEFCGASLDASKWLNVNTSGTGAVAIVDDHTAGGFGALKLSTGAGSGQAIISTVDLPIGSADFKLWTRVRRVGTNTLNTIQIGLFSTALNAYFSAIAGGAISYNVVAPGGSGVATTTNFNTTFVTLELRRTSGIVSVIVNGATVATLTATAAMVDASLVLELANSSSSNAGESRVDEIALWVAR